MTQDRLDFLQTAWNELALAIAAMGGGTVANKPVIISGAVYNGLSVTDGWVIYNNELLHVPAQTVGAPAGGYSWYGVITRTTGTLTYNSGTTHNVINEATIVVTAVATGTPDDATQFYMGNLIPFGLNAGNADRPNGWTHIAVSTSAGSGGVTGDIYCMKDYRANTLHIRGILLLLS